MESQWMNEGKWLVSGESDVMVTYITSLGVSPRRLRLFACACCRRIWHLMTRETDRHVVEVAERYADGLASEGELEAATEAARPGWAAVDEFSEPHQEQWLLRGVVEAASAAGCLPHATEAAECASGWAIHAVAGNRPLDDRVKERARLAARYQESYHQCQLLRCVFGNPFKPRPAIDPAWLRWNDGTVPRLARSIYEGRRFGDMPILLDAGCDDQDILDHCKGPGPHVLGCWVLDLLLGKE
jgi:hypothetical protein